MYAAATRPDARRKLATHSIAAVTRVATMVMETIALADAAPALDALSSSSVRGRFTYWVGAGDGDEPGVPVVVMTCPRKKAQAPCIIAHTHTFSSLSAHKRSAA